MNNELNEEKTSLLNYNVNKTTNKSSSISQTEESTIEKQIYLEDTVMLSNNDENNQNTINSSKTTTWIEVNINENIERTEITKQEFIIGRQKDRVDYLLVYKVVSKVHAKIIKNDEKYYIKDLDSKNGTFINGQKLYPDSKYILNNNDIITLANIEIVFKTQ